MITETKVCLSCSKGLRGRTDKKFCNDYCRNTHNNRLNSENNTYVRSINHCLRKNRRILESFLPAGRYFARVSKNQLFGKGFHFKYFTHSHTNKKGKVFYFCYEFGYVLLENDRVLIQKKEKQTDDEIM